MNNFGFEDHPIVLNHGSVDSLTETLKDRCLAALDLDAIALYIQSGAQVRRDVPIQGNMCYAALIFPGGKDPEKPEDKRGVAILLPKKCDEANKVQVYLESEIAKDRAVKLLGDLGHNIVRNVQSIPDIDDVYWEK